MTKASSGNCFNCDCERTDDQDFKIKSISDPYDIVINKSSELWFTDETDAVAGDEPVFNRHLSNGLDHWLMRVESVHGIDAFINNGLAVGDFNGDGLDDLYVCQPGGLPNRLLLHTKDGKVVSAHVPGCDYLDHTSSALFVDIDNDGDQDLCLATPRELFYWKMIMQSVLYQEEFYKLMTLTVTL